jgi:zinc/manganese transport system ATP-binding protein
VRARDLVRLGLDGHRWGFGRLSYESGERVDATLAEVGATEYADAPIGRLSGGEQQRLRVAQALVADPVLILADEPLLSLDFAHQRGVVDLLDARRQSAGTPVVFVTHDVNPVLHTVDRVLYLAPPAAPQAPRSSGRASPALPATLAALSWAIGTPDEVLTSATLSRLYGTDVDVLHVRGRVVVVGTPDDQHVHHVGEEH